jgi:AraC-like DNA-binding protein
VDPRGLLAKAGLDAAAFEDPDARFHPLGYAVMASTTLREALERNVRYGRLVSDAALPRLEEDGERTSITEITFLLGFADTSSFARAFRRWTGTSPRSFAEQA